MRQTGRGRLAVLVAALTAIPVILSAGPASSVAGTPVTDTSLAYTAQVMVGDNVRGCSGVLVDPQWLATAASCFVDDPAAGISVPAGAPQVETTATIGRADLTGTGGQVRQVVELVPRTDRDLVMARLATPVTTITPVPLAHTAVAAGDTLTVAGYGRTKDAWVPDQLHKAGFTATANGTTDISLAGSTADDAICAGDAGGPVLRQTDSGYELVGINSRSWQGGCFGSEQTRHDATASRIDDTILTSSLPAGTTLATGDIVVSTSARLAMLPDGNLTITSNSGKTLWSTNTAGHPGAKATFTANGNLTVTTPDGATVLWQTGTTAPAGQLRLQNRGNLVVHTADGTSLWSSGTAIRHDYNGDGRSDLGAWYDFTAGTDATYTFFGNGDGSISAPMKSWNAPAGAWDARYMKRVTGDFNGDGRGDIAALYGYSDASLKIWVWLGQSDGGFGTPFTTYSSPAGGFHITYSTPQAGDFDGDGRDDLALWYAYPDGTTKLWTFTGKPDGNLGAPFSSWSAPTGTWLRTRTKFVTGDFNGDGRDDLSVFYGQGDDSVKTYVFPAAADGGFGSPEVWWQTASLDWNLTTPLAGDFNGDGRDDALVWYEYSDGSDKTSTMLSEKVNGTNRFGSAKVTLASPPGNLDVKRMQLVIGDYNGDGRDDLVGLTHLADDSVKFWTWTARPDALFNGGLAGWTAPATSWVYDSTKLVRTHNG